MSKALTASSENFKKLSGKIKNASSSIKAHIKTKTKTTPSKSESSSTAQPIVNVSVKPRLRRPRKPKRTLSIDMESLEELKNLSPPPKQPTTKTETADYSYMRASSVMAGAIENEQNKNSDSEIPPSSAKPFSQYNLPELGEVSVSETPITPRVRSYSDPSSAASAELLKLLQVQSKKRKRRETEAIMQSAKRYSLCPPKLVSMVQEECVDIMTLARALYSKQLGPKHSLSRRALQRIKVLKMKLRHSDRHDIESDFASDSRRSSRATSRTGGRDSDGD